MLLFKQLLKVVFKMLHLLLVLSLVSVWRFIAASSHVVMTMICRDEEVNLRTNLPLWLDVIDYFVFVIDDRNVDSSIITIENILKPSNKLYIIQSYKFEGFGPARTLSLEIAWENYSNASHVLIADPDWRPDNSTLDLNELDNSFDVFRFIAYDRNGITRRRMDWLLQHRAGLAMRYNLHEVLDIGYYSVKDISWVVHEIEMSGSWHTTVGHGNSRSSKRYTFDLNLLYKDQLIFGHDPHVDYYLGITLHAYAETLFVETGNFVEDVINEAIKYLEKRVYSVYKDEFIEERWACMFVLGSIYSTLKVDYVNTVKWYSLCRDYNAKQAECSVSLAKLYLQNGLFDEAVNEIEKVLQEELEERLMLNMIRTKQCDVPEIAARILLIKGKNGVLSLAEWKYMMLLIYMLENPLCLTDTAEIMKEARNIQKAFGIVEEYVLDRKLSLCEDADLQQFLRQHGYVLHPCENLYLQIKMEKMCGIFFSYLPPPVEEYQMKTNYKKFIGSAIPQDFIQHVYGGEASIVFDRPSYNPYRVLFAQYFDGLMVQNLIGVFEMEKFSNYHITIVTDDETILDYLSLQFSVCGSYVRIDMSKIEIFRMPLSQFLRDTSKTFQLNYDFVEYNGGMSIDSNCSFHLDGLKALLAEKGIIGVTYFASNHHITTLKSHLEMLNQSVMFPFSSDARRYIKQYFSVHKLDFMGNDEQLLTFLSDHLVPNERSPTKKWKTFDRMNIVSLLKSIHLKDAAWIPTAYSHPFGEIKHYNVQKFYALGLPEDVFVDQYFSAFRVTIYVVRDNEKFSPLRLKPRDEYFRQSDWCNNVFVLDRLGQFSTSLLPLVTLGKSGISGKFGFTPTFANGFFGLDYVSPPIISVALASLSNKPTLCGLLNSTRMFALENQLQYNVENAISALVGALNYLEHINAISFSTKLQFNTSAFEEEDLKILEELHLTNISLPEVWIEIGEFPKTFHSLVQSISNKVAHVSYSHHTLLRMTNNAQFGNELDGLLSSENNGKVRAIFISSNIQFPSLPWWNKIMSHWANNVTILCAGLNCKLIPEIFQNFIVGTKEITLNCMSLSTVMSFHISRRNVEDGKPLNPKTADIQLRRLRELGLNNTILDEEITSSPKSCLTSITPSKLVENGTPKDSFFGELNKKINTLMGHIGKNIESTEDFVENKDKLSLSEKVSSVYLDENSDEQESQQFLDSFYLQSKNIKLPVKLCSRNDLIASYRRTSCVVAYLEKNIIANCTQRKPLKRRTSAIHITSPRKLLFDTLQIQYLLSLGMVKNDTVEKYLENFQNMLKDVSFRQKPSSKIVKLVADSKHQSPIFLNKGIFLPENELNEITLLWEAIVQLQKLALRQNEQDFAVLDVIMPSSILNHLTDLMRMGSIWFDVSNGYTFATHSDDSLYFSHISLLSQQLANALSTPSVPLKIVKYFAIAMLPDDSFQSAASYANRNEVVAILWLESQSTSDIYLQLLDSRSIECLFRQGVSIYPSVHPDFLSKGGDLDISLTDRCDSYQPELIPFRANRLVVLNSRSPYTFVSTAPKRQISDFKKACIALIFVFEKVNF